MHSTHSFNSIIMFHITQPQPPRTPPSHAGRAEGGGGEAGPLPRGGGALINFGMRRNPDPEGGDLLPRGGGGRKWGASKEGGRRGEG